MIAALKKHWHDLSQEPPGKRFQNRYHERHKGGRKSHRALVLGAGIVLVVAGLVLLLIPGPGSVLIIVGGAFLAEESLVVARMLDRLEVGLRKLVKASVKWWREASLAAQAFVILVGVALLAGAGWLGYSIFLR